jgi:hypothetical protein
MRSLILCAMIAAVAFGLTAPASAGHATMRTAATYPACNCHFGYLGDKSACTPAVTCLTEGGRCRASCGTISEQP